MAINEVVDGVAQPDRKEVSLEEIGDGLWRMCFRQKMLGYFYEATLRLQDELGRIKRNNV